MSYVSLLLLTTALAIPITATTTAPQDVSSQEGKDSVPDLSKTELAAVATITKTKVVATLTFLASDELAGRDTPSPGLDKAAEYVASRMKAAGLKGLGKKGSFYLESKIDTIANPKTGIVLKTKKGKTLPHFGLLIAGNASFSHEGEISEYSSEGEFEGPVFMDVPKEVNTERRRRRGSDPIAQLAARARRKGVTAILLRVDAKSPLIAQAKYRTQPRLQRGRPMTFGRNPGRSIPVLLVDRDVVGQKEHAGISYRLQLPAKVQSKTTVRNVCGILRGSDDKLAEEALLFTAHLDHLGIRSSGKDRIYNGADDDASGVTAVLAIADAYAKLGKKRPARSTIFATFWGEEKGLLGSRHMANNSPWPLDKIVANINIEMIGRPGQNPKDASWVTGWNKSDLGPLMAEGAKRVGITIYEHKRLSAMLYRRSDNYSFVRKGVIAHSFSASSLHKDYHQPGDEWQKINTENMTRVIQGLFAGSLPIAKGLFTPSKD